MHVAVNFWFESICNSFEWFVMQVYKFLDKNFDMVRQDVLDLFTQSKNRVRSRNVKKKLIQILKYGEAWYCNVDIICVFLCVQMVSSLFWKHSESLSQQRSNVRRSSAARRYQANTVSAKFQSSLQELLEKMERF